MGQVMDEQVDRDSVLSRAEIAVVVQLETPAMVHVDIPVPGAFGQSCGTYAYGKWHATVTDVLRDDGSTGHALAVGDKIDVYPADTPELIRLTREACLHGIDKSPIFERFKGEPPGDGKAIVALLRYDSHYGLLEAVSGSWLPTRDAERVRRYFDPHTTTVADVVFPDDVVAACTKGLDDARVPLQSEVVAPLLPLVPGTPGVEFDAQGRVRMTTWTRSAYYPGDAYKPGYAFPLYGETWFTGGTEVAGACATWGLTGAALTARLEQLLGLPPGGDRDAFVQVWVDPKDLRRPCADPDVTHASCPIDGPITPQGADGSAWAC